MYDNNRHRYKGHTIGLVSAFDKEQNKWVQVTKKEFDKDTTRFSGPNKGKINVINRVTGKRSQILKEQFDVSVYVPLADKKYLFRCRANLTGKEKLIHIFEWKLVSNEYEILDIDKFNKIYTTLQ